MTLILSENKSNFCEFCVRVKILSQLHAAFLVLAVFWFQSSLWLCFQILSWLLINWVNFELYSKPLITNLVTKFDAVLRLVCKLKW